VPLVVWTSRSGLGEQLRGRGLMLTPEESLVPAVLQRAWVHAQGAVRTPDWRDAFQDPWLFDVVRSAMGPRNTAWGSRGKARRLLLRGLLAEHDTQRLSAADRMRLLSEPQNFIRLRDQLAAHERQAPRGWAHSATPAHVHTPLVLHPQPVAGGFWNLGPGANREAPAIELPLGRLPASAGHAPTMANA
jgi:membrane glycosyltransferase